MSTTTITSNNNGTNVPVLTPSASSGSQSVASNELTPSTSTCTSGDAPQSPGTEDFDTQLDDYLLQDNFDDGTLHGRISDDLSSSSLHVLDLDLDAAYEARAKAKIEAFNADFDNARE